MAQLNENGLKKYLIKLYGSQKNIYSSLGIDRSTLYRMFNEEPKRLIKHTTTIAKQTDTTKIQLIGEILYRDEQING